MNLDGIPLFLDRIDVFAKGEPAGHIDGQAHQIGMDIHGFSSHLCPPPTATESSGNFLETRDELANVAPIEHMHQIFALAPPVGALRREQPVCLYVSHDVLDLAPASKAIGPVMQQLLDD